MTGFFEVLQLGLPTPEMASNWGAGLKAPWIGALDSSQLLVNECGQLRFAHGTHFGGGQLTIFENHQGWNAPNAKFGRDVAVFIDIHFGNLQFAFVARCNFVQNGGNHLARTAPFSPKINDDRLVGFEHVGLKSGVGCVFDQIAGHGLFLVEIEITAKSSL
jgi:hypothetical protein